MKVSARALATAVAVATAALATAVAATGLLYLVRPLVPDVAGMSDALPLDELSGRASVVFPLFIAIWIAGGAVLDGIVARLGPWRSAAPWVVAGSLLLSLYLLVGTSLVVVRQTSVSEGLTAMLVTPAVYLAVAAATVPAALRTRTRRRRRPGELR